jgi:hypothetical protein
MKLVTALITEAAGLKALSILCHFNVQKGLVVVVQTPLIGGT